MEQQKQNSYLVPISIVLAGVLIAGAVFLTGKKSDGGQVAQNPGYSEFPPSEQLLTAWVLTMKVSMP